MKATAHLTPPQHRSPTPAHRGPYDLALLELDHDAIETLLVKVARKVRRRVHRLRAGSLGVASVADTTGRFAWRREPTWETAMRGVVVLPSGHVLRLFVEEPWR